MKLETSSTDSRVNTMQVTLDEVLGPSWIFRVFDKLEGQRKDILIASCVIIKVDDETCQVDILSKRDSISMKELLPKIKAKVMALGFTNYSSGRGYDSGIIKRGFK